MSLIGTLSTYVKDLAEPIKNAYADVDVDGKWFCNYNRPDIDKMDYATHIRNLNENFNSYLNSNPGATLDDQSNYLIRSLLEKIGKEAACLKEVHGVNPDSVATLSPDIQSVLAQYPDRLHDVAPTLVKYATVPEFGNLVNDLFSSTSSYIIVGSNAMQEKAAEVSSSGDIGLLFGLSIAGITATIYGIKKLSKENLFE